MAKKVKETPVAEAAVADEAVAHMFDGRTFTDEDVKAQIKPLSDNAFVRFFQTIYRWWLGVWYGFTEKHPKLGGIIYTVFFFMVFSVGVTIWQFIIMTFLPYAFKGITATGGWPDIQIPGATNNGAVYTIFGDTAGWGYFIAFEIAVFTAQCINFPLQRNITYRSHGNPYVQALWYFIGWAVVSVATNAIWGICNVYVTHWGWYLPGKEGLATVAGLVKTFLTGGVSMVVFFFIFLIIFPNNEKLAKKTKAKYEKLVAANAPEEKIAKAKAKMDLWAEKALLSTTEKDYATAKSLANTNALKYFNIIKIFENDKLAREENAKNAKAKYEKLVADKASEAKIEKAKAEMELLEKQAIITEEEKAAYDEKLQKAFDTAVESIKNKEIKELAYNKARENTAKEAAATENVA